MRGTRIDLSRIPFDDPATFKAIRAADTVGVFQIESRAQMQSLLRTRPLNLEDLTIQVAIVRPGPIQGGAVNPYIERRRRLREDPAYEVPYEHPALEPILRETLGTIIFQDQVMQVAEAFAGFTPGEADGLRRAMSRKRSHEVLGRQRERFLDGARRHVGRRRGHRRAGVDDGRGLRRLRLPQGPQRRLRPARLPVDVAARPLWRGVPVRAPERAADGLLRARQPRARGRAARRSRCSRSTSTTPRCSARCKGTALCRLGLGYVKGLAAAQALALVAERRRGGPFRHVGDLAARVARHAGHARAARVVGCVRRASPGGAARRSALWQLGMAAPAQESAAGGGHAARPPARAARPPACAALGRWQRLIADYSTTGVTIGDHAIAILRARLPVPMLATSAQLNRLPQRGEVAVAGLVIARQRPGTAEGTTFLLFEDEFGTINLIVPKKVYESHRQLARTEPLLLARGRLERYEERPGAPVRWLPREGSAHAAPATVQGEEIRPVINVIVRELAPLERFLPGGVESSRPSGWPVCGRCPGAAAPRDRARSRRRSRVPRSARACAPSPRPCRASRPDADASVPRPGRSPPSPARVISVDMRFRSLGSSEIEVSEISLGSWLTYSGGVEREQARACVDAAFEAGINFIDTANVYGHGAAESLLGEACGPRALLLRARHEGLLPDVRHRPRAVRGADPQADRCIARAAANGLRRPLPVPSL